MQHGDKSLQVFYECSRNSKFCYFYLKQLGHKIFKIKKVRNAQVV